MKTIGGVLQEKVFLEIVFLRLSPATLSKKSLRCEFFEISKNAFFYRTPLGDCFCNDCSENQLNGFIEVFMKWNRLKWVGLNRVNISKWTLK